MVLQRQVPARSTAKNAEGAANDDPAGAGRNEAFSAALSKEQRSAVAERDRAEGKNQVGAADQPAEQEDQVDSDVAQSDEILNLLSGLMSSAAYSDESGQGAAVGQENPELPATAAPLVSDTIEPDADARPDVLAGNSAAMDEFADNSAPALVTRPAAEAGNGSRNADTKTETDAVKGAPAPAEANIGAGVVKAVTAPAEAKTAPAALASVGAEAAVAQNALPRAKSQTANGGAEQAKDPAAVKEAMRTLGLSGEAAAPVADAARSSIRSSGTVAGNRQDAAAERSAEDQADSKTSKVEVIESRRFMPAPTLSANAQMLTRSLADAGSAALAAQRMAPAQANALVGQPQSGQMLHTLKLQLNPVSLGSVTAVLKLTGAELSVEIKVQNAEAYRQLKDDTQSILKSLRGQGYGVEQITVQHVAGPDRSTGQAPQSGFQGSPQGQGSADAQSSGRESGRHSAGQQGANQQEGKGREQNPYAGAGRTDGVYL